MIKKRASHDFAGTLRHRYFLYLVASQLGILFDMWIGAVVLTIVGIILAVLLVVASFWLFSRFTVFCFGLIFRIQDSLRKRGPW